MENYSIRDGKTEQIIAKYLGSDWLHLSRVPKQDSQTLGNEIKQYA